MNTAQLVFSRELAPTAAPRSRPVSSSCLADLKVQPTLGIPVTRGKPRFFADVCCATDGFSSKSYGEVATLSACHRPLPHKTVIHRYLGLALAISDKWRAVKNIEQTNLHVSRRRNQAMKDQSQGFPTE